MRGVILKAGIGIVVFLCLSAALLVYVMSRMSVFELIMCSTDEGGIQIPGSLCEYYMKSYRSGEEDLQDLAASGVDPILNLDSNRKYEIADFFISKGLDVNGPNRHRHAREDDSTPLHASVLYNDPERAKFLIDHGADLDAESNYHNDMTPLELARNLQKKFPEKDMGKVIRVLEDADDGPDARE